jgi:hypothetical protein
VHRADVMIDRWSLRGGKERSMWERQIEPTETASVLGTTLGAALAGAALMYFLDPDRGRRRRALVRDQLVRAAHLTGDAVDTTSRDVRNRARGVVAELKGWMGGREVDDRVLGERVRSRIGAVVGHAGAIDVAVTDGRVVLAGPVLREEVDRLIRRVAAVRGVKSVESRLDIHAEPGNVPGLQGRPRTPRGGEVFELAQASWSPTARVAVGAAGMGTLAWGVRRGDVLGLVLALSALALVVRAVANRPVAAMTA